MIANDAATRAMTQNGTHLQRGRAFLVALWLTQVALAVMFLMAGGSKLAGVPGMVSLFDAIGLGQWFRYAVYNYAYYLFGAALNEFFPLYVVAFPLSVIALILLLSRTDVTVVAASFRSRAPVRIIGGYLAFVGLGLGSVWLIMWGAYAFAGRSTPIEPEAFKLVAALDVSVMAPALTFGGVLLWRRNAWGYVIAAIAGIQASLYLVVLSVNSYVAVHRGLVRAPGELPIWGTIAVLTAAATAFLLADVQGERG